MADKPSFDPRYHLLTQTTSSENRERSLQENESSGDGNPNGDHDLEIAHKLQRQFYDEERKAEEDDLLFAKRMHDLEQEEVRQRSQFSPVREKFSDIPMQPAPIVAPLLDFDEDESLALAKKLNLEEQEKAATRLGVFDTPNDNLANEDRKIALRMQELEDSKIGAFSPVATLPEVPEDVLGSETDEEASMRKMMIEFQQREDEALARDFQMQEDAANHGKNFLNQNGTFAVGSLHLSTHNQEIDDEALARNFQMQEDIANRNKNNKSGPPHPFTHDQAEEDEALARNFQMQEDLANRSTNNYSNRDSMHNAINTQEKKDEALVKNFQMDEDVPNYSDLSVLTEPCLVEPADQYIHDQEKEDEALARNFQMQEDVASLNDLSGNNDPYLVEPADQPIHDQEKEDEALARNFQMQEEMANQNKNFFDSNGTYVTDPIDQPFHDQQQEDEALARNFQMQEDVASLHDLSGNNDPYAVEPVDQPFHDLQQEDEALARNFQMQEDVASLHDLSGNNDPYVVEPVDQSIHDQQQDDETLARNFQMQGDIGNHSTNNYMGDPADQSIHDQEKEDEALARNFQMQEDIANRSTNNYMGVPVDQSIHDQEKEDEALARNFQMQENVASLNDLSGNNDTYTVEPADQPFHDQQKDDEALARNFQMQEDAAKKKYDQNNDVNNLEGSLDSSDSDELNMKPKAKSNSKIDDIKRRLSGSSQKDENNATTSSPSTPEPELKPEGLPKQKSKPSVPGMTKKKKKGILSRFLPRGKNGESSFTQLLPSRPSRYPNSSGMSSNKGSKKEINSTSRQPVICDVCGKSATHFLVALDKKFHLHCFTCMGCCAPIKPTDPFAYHTNEHGEKFPLHQECHAELFGMKCTVCKETIPYSEDGMVTYVKHPFFVSEQMCPKHAKNPGRRCTGCNRFEPQGLGFMELHDVDRCLCISCCRTVIVDSNDAKPLWEKVMHFFEEKLGITVWDGLRDVPILIVGYETLNESSRQSVHNGSSQIMTRGLCLSEHQSGKRIELARMRFDREHGGFRIPTNEESNGFTYFEIPPTSRANRDSSITAILCLSGLPSDLAASVLAHEATHAWFKLHPNFDIKKPIPLMVEEGCCQLLANLFLSDGLEPASTETFEDSGPSDAALRQYFKFTIETDENEIYGTGFRLAAKAYAQIGIEALLSHVVMYREFPEV